MEKVKINEYMVCVNCMTFNHANYIEDAMNGFCMQQTNFPFVCVIVDDASTDGEPAVIQKYLDNNFDLQNKSVVRNEETDDYVLTFAQHKRNKNCYFAVLWLKYNHYKKKDKKPYYAEWQDNAKYIAICEGDDYWIDENKLQKQVLFLENNPDCSMCFHRAEKKYLIDANCYLRCDEIDDRDYSPNELFLNWIVPTASILERKEAMEVKSVGSNRILNGDIVNILDCAKIGRIHGMSEVMSVYRIQGSGLTYDKKFIEFRAIRYPDHFRFIKDNYSFIDKSMINSVISHSYLCRKDYHKSFWGFVKDLMLAFYYSPSLFCERLIRKILK